MIKSIKEFLEKFSDYDYIVVLDVLDRSFYSDTKQVKITFVSYEWLTNNIVAAKHDELIQLKILLDSQLDLDKHEEVTINLISDVIKLISTRIGE